MDILCAFVAVVTLLSVTATPLDAIPANNVVNFGFGMSQAHIRTVEQQIYEYNVTSADDGGRGVITHFWVTGGDYVCGEPSGKCQPPLNSSNNWNPYIDHIIVRFYVDGETEASIAMTPAMACGTGPFSSRTVAGFFPRDGGVQTPTGWTPPTKMGMTRAPWQSKYFGKGSANGGWWWNVRVPFAKSIRVTTELPPVPGHPEVTSVGCYLQVRGAENIPIVLGGIELPSNARLRLQKIEGREYKWMDRVTLLDVPDGRGAVLMNTYAVECATEGFQEGCVHIYTPRNSTPFPGTLLATGLEDYYNSAYYFSAGQFTQAETGNTWWDGGWNATHPGRWSAYRIHDSDMQFFRDGVKLETRISDTSKTMPDGISYKCIDDSPFTGSGPNATVWSYTFYYEW